MEGLTNYTIQCMSEKAVQFREERKHNLNFCSIQCNEKEEKLMCFLFSHIYMAFRSLVLNYNQSQSILIKKT